MKQPDLAARQFGSHATRYLDSPVHAQGADLERLATLAGRLPAGVALDLGCGAGHASYALARGGARRIVACDIAQPMLDVVAGQARIRGHSGLETHVGHAESLPFADATFDLVVTRYSAHHWLDVERALREAARVLKTAGTLIVIDVLAPEAPLLDTVLQTIEILRDPSHVRDYRESEWRRLLRAAAFADPRVEHWRLPMDFDAWVARSGTAPARVAALNVVFDELPIEARRYFGVSATRSFEVDSGWFEAVLM